MNINEVYLMNFEIDKYIFCYICCYIIFLDKSNCHLY